MESGDTMPYVTLAQMQRRSGCQNRIISEMFCLIHHPNAGKGHGGASFWAVR